MPKPPELLRLAKQVRDEQDPFRRLELLREIADAAEEQRARELLELAERETTTTIGQRLGVSPQAASQQKLRAARRLRKATP